MDNEKVFSMRFFQSISPSDSEGGAEKPIQAGSAGSDGVADGIFGLAAYGHAGQRHNLWGFFSKRTGHESQSGNDYGKHLRRAGGADRRPTDAGHPLLG